MQPLRSLSRGNSKIVMQDFGQLRKHFFSCNLPFLEHVIELRGSDAHCPRRSVKRTGKAFAKLPAQLFGLHLPF